MIARRVVLLVPQLLGVAVLTFALIRLVPGDPVALVLGTRASPERVARLRGQLGLDDPLPVQLGRYLWGLVRGDLGVSLRSGTPVAQEIGLRLGATAALAGVALAVAVVLGLGGGLLAVRARRADAMVRTLAAAGSAVPLVWLAPVVIAVLGFGVTGGVLVPALCVAIGPAAALARVTRSALLEAVGEPFALTARSKGLTPGRVLARHLLPTTAAPVTTVVGLVAGALVSGTVLVEVTFARPGLGRLTVEAVLARDLPVVQGAVLSVAAAYLVFVLAVDVVVWWIDPRERAA